MEWHFQVNLVLINQFKYLIMPQNQKSDKKQETKQDPKKAPGKGGASKLAPKKK
ncbi:hypothetical protein [Antarcticibacterium arcticum]|uniref:hypothetical protein n=1 Tax=Antarcticibacterium arcticum TaxID=2585771 RepID=UPI00196BA2AC|nr:hypothetical protein [Antarcticibacterium arcticum]